MLKTFAMLPFTKAKFIMLTEFAQRRNSTVSLKGNQRITPKASLELIFRVRI